MAFFNIIYTYGLETAYFRFSTKEGHQESGTYALTLSSIILTSLTISAGIVFFSSEIATGLGFPDAGHLIAWIGVILAIDAIVAIPFARLRLNGRARYFVTVKLTNISVNVGLNLLLILLIPHLISQHTLPLIEGFYPPDWGIEYIFLSNLLANLLMIFMMWRSFTTFRFTLSWASFKPILQYAYPFLFTGLAAVTNEMLSRAMLRHWLPEGFYGDQSNLAAVGVFGACYKIAVFMVLAVQAFRYAAEPFFFSQAADKNSPQLFATVMNWFIVFGAFAFLVISLNLDLIGYLFLRAPEYREGLFVVPYLLMGGLLLGIYYNLSVWYKLTDNTIYGVYLAVGGATITFAFNFLLIPVMGYLGSAVTTVVSYGAMVLTSSLMGRSRFHVPYQWPKAFMYITMAIVLLLVFQQLELTLFWSIALRLAASLIFVLLVFTVERKNLGNLTKS